MGLASGPEERQLASSARLELQPSGAALEIAVPENENAAFERLVGPGPIVYI